MSKQNEKKEKEVKRLNQCSNLQELRAFLEASDKPTNAMDLLLLKGGKLPALVETFKKQFPESKDFQSPSKLRAHVKYRESKGWQFETKEDDYYKLKKIA